MAPAWGLSPRRAPKEKYDLVVDRIIVRQEDDFFQRAADAIEIAFYEGKVPALYGHFFIKKIFPFPTALSWMGCHS